MRKLLGVLSQRLKNQIPVVLKAFTGVNVLDKKKSLEKLAFAKLSFSDGETFEMKPSRIWGEAAEEFTRSRFVTSNEVGVYALSAESNKIKMFNNGGVQLDNCVLGIDFGTATFLKTLLARDKREIIQAKNCMPVWSHFWGAGYYDFIFFIFEKAIRIASLLTEEQLQDIKIAYPVFNKSFEKELWQMAGFREDQIIDTKKYNVKADNYFLSNNPSFYYQHTEDIARLQAVMKRAKIEAAGAELIYVSRKGKRQLKNEAEIIAILKDFNFTIIEDKARSVTEQMSIFNNAKVIIGVHGASFANLLWCKPGTHIIELFPKNYYPPHYRFLAGVLKLKYSAIFENNVEQMHFAHTGEDMYIDPEQMRNAISELATEVQTES
jgi:hypothetical protein